MPMPYGFQEEVERIANLTVKRHDMLSMAAPTADISASQTAVSALPPSLPEGGMGLSGALELVHHTLVPALAEGQAGPRYFGFVTGGVLPEALLSDWLVSLYDQNVQVHLPYESISTEIERRAVDMARDLMGLDNVWEGTITTGATASNILALTCAREALGHALKGVSVADIGLAAAPQMSILAAQPHASIRKAASQVGLGRHSVLDLSRPGGDTVDTEAAALELDLAKVEACLARSQDEERGCIVLIGMGEVNTGALSAQLPALAELCARYQAWLHVDAAFSGFMGLVEQMEWVSAHLNLAHSITTDGHKTLNQPYDCGLFFLCREGPLAGPWLEKSYGAGGKAAAYLASSDVDGGLPDEILSQPSPLNRNIENSRRFRALPLYVSLLSQGREGYRALVTANVRTAGVVRDWLRSRPDWYEVLTPVEREEVGPSPWTAKWSTTIVLFRPRKGSAHALARKINSTRRMYVSRTSYLGGEAIRLAVSNWSTTAADEAVVLQTLEEVAREMN